MKNNSIACRTTWQIFTTTSGTLKQLYERFSPHINKGLLSKLCLVRLFEPYISFPTRIYDYLLIVNKSHLFPFKQSRRSLYASCITAESLCPTSFQCIYPGRAVCDRSPCGQFAQNLQLRSQGCICIGGWSKNSTSELLL